MSVLELIKKLGQYDGSMEVVSQFEGVQSTFDSGCFEVKESCFNEVEGEKSLVIYADGDV